MTYKESVFKFLELKGFRNAESNFNVDIWHVLGTYEDCDTLEEFIDELDIDISPITILEEKIFYYLDSIGTINHKDKQIKFNKGILVKPRATIQFNYPDYKVTNGV